MISRRASYIMGLIAIICVTVAFAPARAQNTAPTVTKTAEYSIGFDCPVSATLDAAKNILWVLMDDCGNSGYTLQGFNLSDGSPVNPEDRHLADQLTELEFQTIYSISVPLGLTPDGTIDILYNETQNYDTRNVRLSVTTAEPPPATLTLLTNDTLQKLVPGYAGYPETTTYSADHTLAVVFDTNTFHIIDLQTGKERFQIDSPLSTDYSTAAFSNDKTHLYIATAKNLDNPNDMASTLNIYQASDGKLLHTYDVPTYTIHVSPDGRYLASPISDKELVVTDLVTGQVSQPITIPEKPHAPTVCLNTGKKISAGVGFMTRGDLFVMDVLWLPDSSGFLTVNSYLGDGAGGDGGICIFDYSRLRIYKVE